MVFFIFTFFQRCDFINPKNTRGVIPKEHQGGDTQRALLFTREVIPKERNEVGIWVGLYVLEARETYRYYCIHIAHGT